MRVEFYIVGRGIDPGVSSVHVCTDDPDFAMMRAIRLLDRLWPEPRDPIDARFVGGVRPEYRRRVDALPAEYLERNRAMYAA